MNCQDTWHGIEPDKHCQSCKFWEKLRPKDNWGTCNRIQPHHSEGVIVYMAIAHTFGNQPILQTKDMFGCIAHEAKQNEISR